MDEDRSPDPTRRGRLLSPPSEQPQTPRTPALPMDLSSQYQRRFAQSLFLPLMGPRLAPGSGFSAFSDYQGPPTLAPAAAPGGSHLARSLPKAPFFSTDSLAPLPYSADPAAGAGAGAGAAVPRSPPSLGSEQQGTSASGLPPRGTGHRRSRSDFLIGFSLQNQLPLPAPLPAPPADAAALEELFRSYRDPRTLGVLVSSGGSPSEKISHLGNQVSGQRAWSPADSSDNEAESWANGRSGGGSASHPRHCRSLSVDSLMGSLNFGNLGQVSQTVPPPSGAGGSLSHTASGPSGNATAVVTSELANGEFSESEMKKIMANDRLAEIVLSDPKRVKRILANRISAAKSKERKVKYMGELERRVHVLQMETNTLSSKAALSQRENEALKTQNKEIMIRLQAMEQQGQLKDALNQALSAEVLRLKQTFGEATDAHAVNGLHHHMNRQILEQQLLQQQKQPSEAQKAQQQQQQPQGSEQFKASVEPLGRFHRRHS